MRRDREYREVVVKGERTSTPHFTVYRDDRGAAGNAEGAAPPAAGLVGISVGRKAAASATARNRLKRLLREFCRLHKFAFPPGTRTAIVARKAPPGAGLASVTAELLPAILGSIIVSVVCPTPYAPGSVAVA